MALDATPETHRSSECIKTRDELDVARGTEPKSKMLFDEAQKLLFSKLSLENILTDRETSASVNEQSTLSNFGSLFRMKQSQDEKSNVSKKRKHDDLNDPEVRAAALYYLRW